MKTSGEVVPFAPPANSVWTRSPIGDELTILRVSDGKVIYTFSKGTGAGMEFEMPVEQWQQMYRGGKLRRIAVSVNDPIALARRLRDYYLSQGASLTSFKDWQGVKGPLPMEAFEGVEDLVSQALTLDYGIDIVQAIRITGQVMRELQMDKPSEFVAHLARIQTLSYDWSNLDTEQTYRQDWPYSFKWTFNNRTGEPFVWQVTPGGDGRPYHRTMYQSQGWDKSDGLALGQAIVKPAERKLDGTVVEPAECRVLYYPSTTQRVPEPILAWFQRQFPDALIHEMDYTRGNMYGSVEAGRHDFMWTSQPENWGNEERIAPQPSGWRPSMPSQVLEIFKQRSECPYCESNAYREGEHLHCSQCPWKSENEPNWPASPSTVE